ncbi:MAG: nucleotide exchange factor GrpE [Desulfobulbaceae bacterium]|nr:nucleotide exchange factor GrpE [Desulfobulbaceae bacterium]
MVDDKQKAPDSEQEEIEVPEDLGEVEGIAEEGGDQEQDYEALQQELEEALERMLRIAADAENFKKRVEREREKMIKYAGENILRELLTTLDNLDRAMEQGQAEADDVQKKLDGMLEGLELTRKGLVGTLERFDVKPLDSVGQEFNPDEQDALTMEASEEVPANHVLREFARGYRFKDRVLRHAQVVVSSGPGK